MQLHILTTLIYQKQNNATDWTWNWETKKITKKSVTFSVFPEKALNTVRLRDKAYLHAHSGAQNQ